MICRLQNWALLRTACQTLLAIGYEQKEKKGGTNCDFKRIMLNYWEE